MGESLDRGQVLVFSIWDDSTAQMQWLDGHSPLDGDESKPGVLRGPCDKDSGKPD